MRSNSLRLALGFTSALASSFVSYKALGLVSNTDSPFLVVLSESMEPAIHRGDILFLSNPSLSTPLNQGDIIVYNRPSSSPSSNEIPIVHRVIEVHTSSQSGDGKEWLMTKGDNNNADDTVFYNGDAYLERKQVVGRVYAFLPYVGYASIVFNEHPWVKYALFGILGLLGAVGK